jgi:hypothetical protein
MSWVMSRANSLLFASLIVLGLAVLARVVVISQHAYAVLLPPPPVPGDDLGPATAAVAVGQSPLLATTTDTESGAAPLVVSEPEVSSENPVNEGPPAKPEVARQIDSESGKATLTQARRHHKAYNYRYSSGRLQSYWGPAVW